MFCLEARIDQHWSKPVFFSSLIFQRTISFGYLKNIKIKELSILGISKKLEPKNFPVPGISKTT
jgi:hypothetical protein